MLLSLPPCLSPRSTSAVNITVPFLSVNVPNFKTFVLLSSYDFIIFGSRMADDKDKNKGQKRKKP